MAQPVRDAIVVLLRDLARQIQSLDDKGIEDLVAGKLKLQLHGDHAKQVSRTSRRKVDDNELRELAQTLRTLRSREEGEKLLNNKITLKHELERLARILDLPVQKDDTAEQLRARLIESTIGFRIRSAAIQGAPPQAMQQTEISNAQDKKSQE